MRPHPFPILKELGKHPPTLSHTSGCLLWMFIWRILFPHFQCGIVLWNFIRFFNLIFTSFLFNKWPIQFHIFSFCLPLLVSYICHIKTSEMRDHWVQVGINMYLGWNIICFLIEMPIFREATYRVKFKEVEENGMSTSISSCSVTVTG